MKILYLLISTSLISGCSLFSYDGYDFEQCQLIREGHYYCDVSLQAFRKYSFNQDAVAEAVTKKKFENTDLCPNGYDIKLQYGVLTGTLGYYWNVVCRKPNAISNDS